MQDIKEIINCLEQTPEILENMINSVPEDLLRKKRIPGKWTIHEHACHIIAIQPMLIKRFELFINEEKPEIEPYIPGKTDPDDDLLDMDLNALLKKFPIYRKGSIDLVKTFNNKLWQKKAIHPEYIEYTPYILLRHILMHEHLHMYKIEELCLTTDKYL